MAIEDFQAQFTALQQQFVKGLVQRQQALRRATSVQESQAVLHRLAGAAGAYGYDDLGNLARTAMNVMDTSGIDGAEPFLQAVYTAISALMSAPDSTQFDDSCSSV